jgi:hypothetical protein
VPTLTCGLVRSNLPFAMTQTSKELLFGKIICRAELP